MRTRTIPFRWLPQPVMAAATTLALAAGGFEVAPTTAGADSDFAVTSIFPIVPATPLPSPFQFRTTVYKEDPTSSDALIYAHVLCA
jgi:hypothetical protein